MSTNPSPLLSVSSSLSPEQNVGDRFWSVRMPYSFSSQDPQGQFSSSWLPQNRKSVYFVYLVFRVEESFLDAVHATREHASQFHLDGGMANQLLESEIFIRFTTDHAFDSLVVIDLVAIGVGKLYFQKLDRAALIWAKL